MFVENQEILDKRYRVIKKLGGGAFGDIFKGKNITFQSISEKYTLSRIHSKIKRIEADADRLIELVPRVVFEFKNSLILEMIKQKLNEMRIANDNKNDALVDQIMRDMGQLEIVKKQLSKSLGERIIIKL